MTAQTADQHPHEDETHDIRPMPDIDSLLVGSISRWAIATSLLILLYDAALMTNYPFPGSNTTLRGVFYSVVAVALIAAVLFITFLGYRLATMRVVREGRKLYVIFLPALVLFASISGFLLLAAPK
jgi:hypothetical protein